jgi:cation transport protein ChaC
VTALRLTAAHIARIHREVPETPGIPGFARHTDAEFAAWTARLLADDPEPDGALKLFVYGSLLWKPEVAHVAETPALLHGWHRAFCMRLPRFRGTEELPGLMMALDRGGACRGMVLTVEPGEKTQQMDKLFRREMPFSPTTNLPRWVPVQTAAGPVRALTFVMNRASTLYTGPLSAEAVADVLATACGYGGTGAEYLLNTVAQLEQRGIRDSLLWQLQAMVADRIEAQV